MEEKIQTGDESQGAMDLEKLVRQRFDDYYNSLVSPSHRDATLSRVHPDISVGIASIAGQMPNILTCQYGRGMFLIGPVGVGKTSILALLFRSYLRAACRAVVNSLPKDGNIASIAQLGIFDRADVGFCTHEELIESLRSEDFEERKRTLRTVMFIDDFGRGYDDKAGWNLSRQDNYFDHRWRNKLPTFITSNLTAKQLRSWPGWERVVDRLGDPEWMEALVVNSESRRK